MPLRPREHAAPSHLGVVLRAIDESIREIGNATPIMVGAHYAVNPRGVGAAPFVILVPEPRDGACAMGAPFETGRAAMHMHECDVIVRAAESGGDIDRLDAAYELSDLVVATVREMCAGRVEFGPPIGTYPSPTTSDAFGAGLSWSFTYSRDVAKNPAIGRRVVAPFDDTPAAPYGQPGETGTLNTIDGVTVDAG